MLFDVDCVVCRGSRGPVCQRCEASLMPAPKASVEGVTSCRSAFQLDPVAREMIAAFKYRRERQLATWFAHRVASLIPRGADALTWLPATPERKRQRGFDQAQELTRSLAQITQVPVLSLLARDHHDGRQTGQSRAERLSGPQLRARRRSPGFVVVIDDVITTGSSLRVAARQLRSAGAKRVVAVTIAATPAETAGGPRGLSPRLDQRV